MKIIADANIPFVAECFSSIGKVEVIPANQITPAVVANADILLVRSVTQVNSTLLAESSVRFVATATIGFEHIDIEYLSENNIGFASAPGSNANSVAEYVIAGLLEAAKKYEFELKGKSIGIVGVGNVGSRIAQKCNALGMKVCLNDPPLKRKTGDVKYLPIENLLDCDFITVHTPLTFEDADRTFHLADEEFFKSLKQGCVFVNTSRGGVVDTEALKAVTKAGKLKAVILDVWENEPGIDTELLEMVDIGTPHIAGYSMDGKVAGMLMIYRQVCKYFGLEAEFDMKSFLPEPAIARLKISLDRRNEQEVLLDTVRKIYDIKEDDSRLRQILDIPEEKRGKFFSQLRRDYPVRREFQNTKIESNVADTENIKKLSEKLKAIGFKVTSGK